MASNSLQHPITRWRLTQEPKVGAAELAARAEVSATSLSRVERGLRDRLGYDASSRLSKITGIDTDELMNWRWTKAGRLAAQRVLGVAAREFRARASSRRPRRHS